MRHLQLFKFGLFIILMCVSNTETLFQNEGTELNSKASQDLGFSEGRKKEKEDVMSKILPMIATPFIMQATFLPVMLMMMKFTLVQSMFLGKMAILFGLVTLLRNSLKKGGGLFSHNINLQPSHSTQHRSYSEDSLFGRRKRFINSDSLEHRKKKRNKI